MSHRNMLSVFGGLFFTLIQLINFEATGTKCNEGICILYSSYNVRIFIFACIINLLS